MISKIVVVPLRGTRSQLTALVPMTHVTATTRDRFRGDVCLLPGGRDVLPHPGSPLIV